MKKWKDLDAGRQVKLVCFLSFFSMFVLLFVCSYFVFTGGNKHVVKVLAIVLLLLIVMFCCFVVVMSSFFKLLFPESFLMDKTNFCVLLENKTEKKCGYWKWFYENAEIVHYGVQKTIYMPFLFKVNEACPVFLSCKVHTLYPQSAEEACFCQREEKENFHFLRDDVRCLFYRFVDIPGNECFPSFDEFKNPDRQELFTRSVKKYLEDRLADVWPGCKFNVVLDLKENF